MPQKRGKPSYAKKDAVWGYLFVLPAMILIAVWIIYPMIFAFRLSFMNFKYLTPEKARYVGFANYIRAFSDDTFKKALTNTFKYSLIVVPVQTIISLLLALVCNSRIKGKTFFKVAYYIPSITSALAVGTMFKFLFNQQGIINRFLSNFGFHSVSWFEDPSYALPLCMIMAIWSSVGGGMILFLAGLQDIPSSVIEAAQVDGANGFQRFLKIILPLLRPTIFFAVVTGIIGTLQVFDQAYIVSRGSGGPLDSTMTVVLYIYNKGFRTTNANMGYPSALAFLLFAIIFTLTLIQKKFFDKGAESY
ncbi:carbohydrate ABC transporter membrane protein 1, CUT1 family [Caloramator quimbayensis]|uniref:Carbohydrate ABC transporter membrane protein 1, CUT1 family n=1 Tax=Caloramator quimbayensis TaxID=1147123 RepID=A0A1T4WP26_9CLOT|nr:sugar ABC transporter permease [Caloramator quimbayensis]SKA78635.1 carbohydrate ABC transporter membrane protein 1, CUT1 family [Caloramator quimbayensis]